MPICISPNELQAKYRKFSNNNNLLYDTKRASVEGYRRVSVKGLQDLENRDILKQKIAKGKLSLEINLEMQNHHILSSKEYVNGKVISQYLSKNCREL